MATLYSYRNVSSIKRAIIVIFDFVKKFNQSATGFQLNVHEKHL